MWHLFLEISTTTRRICSHLFESPFPNVVLKLQKTIGNLVSLEHQDHSGQVSCGRRVRSIVTVFSSEKVLSVPWTGSSRGFSTSKCRSTRYICTTCTTPLSHPKKTKLSSFITKLRTEIVNVQTHYNLFNEVENLRGTEINILHLVS